MLRSATHEQTFLRAPKYLAQMLCLALISAAAPSGPAQADTELTYSNSSSADAQMESLLIKDGQLRMNLSGGDWMLYRQGEAALIFVDTDKRQYTVMDQAMLDQVGGAIAQAKAELDAALAQMPPSQREQMRKIMESSMGQLSGGEQGLSFSLRETGQTQQINGVKCREVEALRGGQHFARSCLAKAADLNVSASDARVFSAWAEFTQGMMEKLAAQADGLIPFEAPNFGAFAQGLPIQNIDQDGERTELQSYRSDSLETSLFQIPSDYRRQSLDADF